LELSDKNDHFPERFGFEMGLRANYNLSPKFKLEAGLNFMYLHENMAFSTTSGLADSQVVQQNENQLTINTFTREEKRTYRNNYYLGGLYLGGSYTVQRWQQESL